MVSGSTEQELKLSLELHRSYLVRSNRISQSRELQEIYVEQITEKAFKLKRYSTDNTYCFQWIEIEKFYKGEEVFEELPHSYQDDVRTTNTPPINFDIMEMCPICRGEGQIPDDKSTA